MFLFGSRISRHTVTLYRMNEDECQFLLEMKANHEKYLQRIDA